MTQNEYIKNADIEEIINFIRIRICESHLGGCSECSHSSRYGCRCYDDIKQQLQKEVKDNG